MEGLVRQQSAVPCGVFGQSRVFLKVRLPGKGINNGDIPDQMQEYPVEVDWESWGSCWRFNGEWPLCPGSACCGWTSELSFSLWSLQYYGIKSSKDCWELSSGWFQGHILLLDWFTLLSGGEPPASVNKGLGGDWDKRVWVWNGAVGDCSTRVSPVTSDNSWQFTNLVCITSVLESCMC